MKTLGLRWRFAIPAVAALGLCALSWHRAEETPAPVPKIWELWPKRAKPIGNAVHSNHLAMELSNAGKYAEAEKELRTELDARSRLVGPNDALALQIRTGLAREWSNQGKHADAEREHRAVMAFRRREFGAEDPETLSSWTMLAATLKAQGRNAEAEKEYRSVLAVTEHVEGREGCSDLWTRIEFAAVLDDQGKHSEAEKELRAVLAIRKRESGADESHDFLTCVTLARCLEGQKKFAEALALVQRMEEGFEKRAGPEHPSSKFAKQQRERVEAEWKKQQAIGK